MFKHNMKNTIIVKFRATKIHTVLDKKKITNTILFGKTQFNVIFYN